MSLYWKLNKISRKIIIRQQRHLNIKLTDCNSLSEILTKVEEGIRYFKNTHEERVSRINKFDHKHHIYLHIWETINNTLQYCYAGNNLDCINAVFELIYKLKKNNLISNIGSSDLKEQMKNVIYSAKKPRIGVQSNLLNQAITSEEELFREVVQLYTES